MNLSAILDKNYIPRLNTLLFSLRTYCSDFTFYVVALDDETYCYFNQQSNCISISIAEIQAFYPILSQLKQERDPISYIFTLSPFYPSYILEKFPEIDHICSLDSDQYFFSSPQPVFDLLHDYSVLITPHRFSKKLEKLDYSRFGKYNVSFQVFKRDEVGLSCLALWRDQCTAWCFDREENGLYADQKYLDVWEEILGDKVHVIQDKGLGLAPWNIEDAQLQRRQGKLFIDENELIVYHYQGLKLLQDGYVYTFLDHYTCPTTNDIHAYIYKPLVRKLLEFTSTIDSFNRNNRTFDYDFMVEKADFVFKKKFGFIFEFRQYLKLQNWVYGLRNRFTNIFRR